MGWRVFKEIWITLGEGKMNKSDLGRLVSVDPRTYWDNEAYDFTPWLTQEENLALLGEVLGLELELRAQEEPVGPFRADILCKDTITNQWVLIENQLERTDHNHLGQLITYAAGLDAVTIVWIADRFTDEHRAAMDWLNEISNESANFFGLEVELWQIGDSAMAPKFNIVSKPNDWIRSISQYTRSAKSRDLTEIQQLQLDFWTEFHEHLLERKSPVKPQKPNPQNWMNFAIGRSYFHLIAIINTREQRVRTGLVIYGQEGKAHYHLLHQERDKIESEIGEQLEWRENPGKVESHIYWHNLDLDPLVRDKWPEIKLWLAESLETLNQVFRGLVKSLNASEYNDPQLTAS
jgi:hypothetical protein